MRTASSIAIAAAIAASGALAQPAGQSAADGGPVDQGPANVPEFTPAFPEQTRAPAVDSEVELQVETFAAPLERPWGITALPGGGYLVTERPGRLRHVSDGGEISEPIGGVPEVVAQRQGGLLDVTLSSDFQNDRTIFFTYSKATGDGLSATAAARGRLSQDMTQLTEVQDIWVQEPPAPEPMHYGSRIVIDGDIAWITTGERFTEENRQLAQQRDATYGKVVRVHTDGSIPQDNPFVGQEGALDPIWSLGHRNIQAADIRPDTGEFWLAEHGPQGGDELNHARAGENYGWPLVAYGENYDGSPVGTGEEGHDSRDFVEPRYYWDPVIAPSGMVFYRGELFPWQGDVLIGSLVPGSLVRLELDGDTVTGEERLAQNQGRVRDVVEGLDGSLLLLIDSDAGAVLRVTPQGG